MDKGIRPYCNRVFLDMLPQLPQLGNVEFRRAVMNSVQEAFGLTVLQAATHYNHAFKEARKTHADQLLGLGRPEDKKGGRKRKAAADSVVEPAVEPEPEPEPEPAAASVELVTVVRVRDQQPVASAVTREAAMALIEQAVRNKKAKLAIQ